MRVEEELAEAEPGAGRASAGFLFEEESQDGRGYSPIEMGWGRSESLGERRAPAGARLVAPALGWRMRRLVGGGSGDVGVVAEVRGHVGLGAEQALLFAAPEGEADGAARLELQSGDDAGGFHGGDGPGAVVGCAGPGVPGVEMAAEHDDFGL